MTTNTDKFELCLMEVHDGKNKITEFLKFRAYRYEWALLDYLDNKYIASAEKGSQVTLGHRQVFTNAGEFLSLDSYYLIDAEGTFKMFMRCSDMKVFLIRKLPAFDCNVGSITISFPIGHVYAPEISLEVVDADAGLRWKVKSFTIPVSHSVEQVTSDIKEFVMSGYDEVASGNIGSYKFTIADFKGVDGSHSALPIILRKRRQGCTSVKSVAHQKLKPDRETLKKPAKAAVKIKPNIRGKP